MAFSERGFAATRMEDIARLVGISKAALYLQFPSKEALFQACTMELIEAMLPSLVPEDPGDVPAEYLLRGMIAAIARRMADADTAFLPRVIIGEGTNFPVLARFYYDRVVARGLAVFERIIQHGIARGEFVSAHPAHACRTIVGGVLVTAIWKHVFEPVGADPIDITEMAQSHADTLIDGLKLRKESC